VPFEPRPELRSVTAVAHGSVPPGEVLAAGLDPVATIDFSVSTNPLGPPPGAVAAVAALAPPGAGAATGVWRYPDATARPLREALARRIGVDPEAVVAGNGSAELIWSLALAAVRAAPEMALILGPTFGEYARACRLLGARLVQADARREEGFRPHVAALAAQIARQRPRVVWLCNPNNPTGSYLLPPDVGALLDACAAAGALLVVDEAYLAFVDAPASLLDRLDGGHLFLLRSLTKDYGLAGLRLGYGVTSPALAAAVRLAQPPWSVGAPAQAAGLAALEDAAHLERARAEVRRGRRLLVGGLSRLGFRVTPPAANFVLFEVGNAAAFRSALLARGCVVRDGTSFGLPAYVRVGVRTQQENERLLAAIADLEWRA
jgi:threonine-phosphate decarboxylase